VWFTPYGDARDNRLPDHVRRALRAAMFVPDEPDLDDLANASVTVDRPDVQVMALKPAFRDRGVIVRLSSFARSAIDVRVSCPSRPIRQAVLCDAHERDIRTLAVKRGVVTVPMPLSLASVHIRF